jgi:hypothetical protein
LDLYKVKLPDWVFVTANNEDEIEHNAVLYLKRAYPERRLIEVEGDFAVCEMKDI